MYYLRTRPAVDAIKFTVDKQALKDEDAADKEAEDDDDMDETEKNLADMSCSIDNRDNCISCGS